MRKTQVYLVEKVTGIKDSLGVELLYTVAVRLTRAAAETEFKNEIDAGRVRIRKLFATK